MAVLLTTARLVIRDWTSDDAEAAFSVYGDGRVAPWLLPAMSQVPDVAAMRCVLEAWTEAGPNLVAPAGRWAVIKQETGEVVGGVSLRLLPPYNQDLEIGWQLAPRHWGNGYATEAGRALAEWSFAQGAEELFAVVGPRNERGAATARRIGMEWVGETDKYYDRLLQVYRIRPGDLRVADRRADGVIAR
jgi:[ribosomal protein S5]-alanine N-acetyltransferase